MRASRIAALTIVSTFILALAGLWIAAPAAGSGLLDPTAQQATVDAAVQTLFAQTAPPPDMTQTVAAAFSAAQTATAAALPPAPVSVDALQAAEVIELPLLAGPVGTAAYLAPDGERIAYLNGAELCILDIDTANAYIQTTIAAGAAPADGYSQVPDQIAGAACVSLENVRALNRETVSWSPDGRYLVMTEDFFRRFKDADLWVLDTETMTLADITNDERDDYPLDAAPGDLPPVDVCPRWMPDGRVVFLRYGADPTTPAIYTIRPDGSDLQQTGQITAPQRFAVYALAVSQAGQLAYNFWLGDESLQAQNGVWISALDGSDARQVWHDDQPNMVPGALEWSPDGQYIAMNIPNAAYGMTYEPTTSFWRAVRVSDGQTIFFALDQFVFSMGWSPEGSGVVYTTHDQLRSEKMGLYVAAEPGAPGRMLVPASPDPATPANSLIGTTPQQGQVIPWTANGTVIVTHGGEESLLIIRLAAP
jgi:Tol biopolymer transport system component